MDVDAFIERMETSYSCSDDFKSKMRAYLDKIREMDVESSTKHLLLQKAEETYRRHSINYSALNDIETNNNLSFERFDNY